MIQEFKIPNAVGFCKNCFRSRRDGSAYCGECQDEPERMKVFISDDQFPLLDKVLKKFKIKSALDLGNIIFTYGDTMYSSYKTLMEMPFHLVAHELTHVFQQTKMGRDEWWKQYLADDKFRLDQEVEAYRQQYKVAKAKNEANAAYVLERVAGDLSSALYGNIIKFDEAKKLILEEK